jgi:hypothetical protein
MAGRRRRRHPAQNQFRKTRARRCSRRLKLCFRDSTLAACLENLPSRGSSAVPSHSKRAISVVTKSVISVSRDCVRPRKRGVSGMVYHGGVWPAAVIVPRRNSTLFAFVLAAPLLASSGHPAAGWRVIEGTGLRSGLSSGNLPPAMAMRAGLGFLCHLFEARRPGKPASPPPEPSGLWTNWPDTPNLARIGGAPEADPGSQEPTHRLVTPHQPRAPPATAV